MTDARPMLEVADLHAYYAKSHVLHGVNLKVGAGEIVCLLGRNGVGRSTTAKAVMGLVTGRGSVRFKGREILGRKAYEIAHFGVEVEEATPGEEDPETLEELRHRRKAQRHVSQRDGRRQHGEGAEPVDLRSVSQGAQGYPLLVGMTSTAAAR